MCVCECVRALEQLRRSLFMRSTFQVGAVSDDRSFFCSCFFLFLPVSFDLKTKKMKHRREKPGNKSR